jgi:hypothetical protein
MSDIPFFHLQGVTQAYKSIVPTLTFAGPTYISPILKQTIDTTQRVHVDQNAQSYTVLLIITVSDVIT